MAKNIQEVFATIKEGEVWECNSLRITKSDGLISICAKTSKTLDPYSIGIGLDVEFKLVRKEYIFAEAFKAYEEGKEIESYVTKDRYKRTNEKNEHYNCLIGHFVKYGAFSFEEIRGKWYIND